MYKKYGNKFMCFSPPVMLATFLIEFAFAFYVLWRYKMTTVSRLVVTTLFALGTFQLAEYMICGGLGWTHTEWARVGYGAITLLPALGIHLVAALAGKKAPWLVTSAYASCAAFVAFFMFAGGAISGQECRANYAVFDTHDASVIPFALYYYGWMIAGTIMAWKWAGEAEQKNASALQWMSIGYLAFMLPTTTVNLIDPATVQGIPSIMCGFAVLLAFVLVIKVLPGAVTEKATSLATVKARLGL